MSMFASLDIYHDESSRTAPMNMAVDEALLERATAPSIRFYQWDHPALSFGYFGRCADVAVENRDLVRRWTGGGIVFHGDDLTYSIVIPARDPAFTESSMSIYEKVHGAICKTFVAYGQAAKVATAMSFDRGRGLWGVHAPSRAGDRALAVANFVEDFGEGAEIRTRGACASQMCFANSVRCDVLINDRKVAGAAQRRTRRGLLQQGSIQGVDISNGFTCELARELSVESHKRQIDNIILKRASEIAEQKYATLAWLRRR